MSALPEAYDNLFEKILLLFFGGLPDALIKCVYDTAEKSCSIRRIEGSSPWRILHPSFVRRLRRLTDLEDIEGPRVSSCYLNGGMDGLSCLMVARKTRNEQVMGA